MKRIIFGVFILALSITFYFVVNIKFSNLEYNKMASDTDNYYMILGTKNVLVQVMDDEKLNWGKNNDNTKRNNYYKYIDLNLIEMKYKLSQREYDLYNQKMTQFIKLLEEFYNLKAYVGEDYETFTKKHDKLLEKIEKKLIELEEVVL